MPGRAAISRLDNCRARLPVSSDHLGDDPGRHRWLIAEQEQSGANVNRQCVESGPHRSGLSVGKMRICDGEQVQTGKFALDIDCGISDYDEHRVKWGIQCRLGDSPNHRFPADIEQLLGSPEAGRLTGREDDSRDL